MELHSTENEDTYLPLTAWALSFSETPWSEEIKGTDGIDLRSEQDEFKTLKGRDRNSQDTIAVLLLSFVQWAVVDLENCSEKIPQGVDLRRLVIHNDHKVSGLWSPRWAGSRPLSTTTQQILPSGGSST